MVGTIAALPRGTVLAGRFLLEESRARGGFGLVYPANDRKLGRKVAIKEFAPWDMAVRRGERVEPVDTGVAAAFRQGLDRFIAEAVAIADIDHSNVVRVHDHIEANGTAYLVMEWIEGSALRKLVADRARWQDDAAIMAVLNPLLDGLAAVHDRGWVHRDLKPDNIMVRARDGQPVLLDFGIARTADATHFSVALTPGYAPPEQNHLHSEQGPWSDIYALAGVAYCLMTGRDPVDALPRLDAVFNDRPDPLPSAEQLTRELPYSRALVDAVMGALALKAPQRPQSVAAWRARLAVTSRVPVEIVSGAWPRPGCVFRDRARGGGANLVLPEMVVIPNGSFTMGAPAGEEEREGFPKEYRGLAEPCHKVTIVQPFALSRCSVTRGQFRAFLNANPNHSMTGGAWGWNGTEWKTDAARDWRNPGFAQTDDHPVVCISWQDAQAYVQWVSGLTGMAYRLPSEAEWEYACRAGTTTARYWGDRQPTDQDANFNDSLGGTTVVGSYPANGFGLHDMLGNVYQWAEDTWHGNYQGAPTDGSAWTTGDSDSARVVRGGCWGYIPVRLRSANRLNYFPDHRDYYIGFRLARTLPLKS
jgi:formylglycine-generating enzyme required for sulfatase activity